MLYKVYKIKQAGIFN